MGTTSRSASRSASGSASRSASGSASDSSPIPQFTEIAASAGIRFRHDNGGSGRFHYPEIVGPGCALFDYDNDGRLDIFLVQAAPLPGWKHNERLTNRLYRNKGDGTFEDVTEKAGVSGIVNGKKTYGMGCATGDFNNDGYDDLLVTCFGKCILYRNNGGRKFTDVTDLAGLKRNGFWTSAAFFDYDNDSYLDLFVCNYITYHIGDDIKCGESKENRDYCPPGFFPPSRSALYHNNRNGTFTDVTASAGITSPFNKALGVIAGDFSGDGKPDIYIACDLTPKLLYIQKNGKFTEHAMERGVSVNENGEPQASMGADFRDYDGDMKPDIIVTNYWFENNNLYRDMGNNHYSDVSFTAGIGQPSLDKVGWGVGFRDFNNDGQMDCYVANGHVLLHPERTTPRATAVQSDQLFLNMGKGILKDVSSRAGEWFRTRHMARGAAFGDINNDGKIDVVIAHNNDSPSVLINRCPGNNHWLELKLVGKQCNRDAIGAKVTVTVAGRKMFDEVRSAYSYASSNDLRLHFGLGQATHANEVEIHFPDGTDMKLGKTRADQILRVLEK